MDIPRSYDNFTGIFFTEALVGPPVGLSRLGTANDFFIKIILAGDINL